MKSEVIDQSFRYVSQNSEAYRVTNESGHEISIDKVVPTNAGDGMHHDFRQKWMNIAAIGLPLGGVLTIIFALLVIWHNVQLLGNENVHTKERIHAKNLIITSIVLFILGAVFFSLFIMHLLY